MKNIMILLISLLLISNVNAVDLNEQSMGLDTLDEVKVKTIKVIEEKIELPASEGTGTSAKKICDFDGNGITDLDDAVYMSTVRSWFNYSDQDLRADVYEDGIIDLNDVVVFSQNINTRGWCHDNFWAKLNPEEVEESEPEPTNGCDFDGNGQIDLDDAIYQSIVMQWFTYSTPDLRADLYEDGIIDLNDIIIFSQNKNTAGWCHNTFWAKLNPEEPIVEDTNDPRVRNPQQNREILVESFNTEEPVEETSDEDEVLPLVPKVGFFKGIVDFFMGNLTKAVEFVSNLI